MLSRRHNSALHSATGQCEAQLLQFVMGGTGVQPKAEPVQRQERRWESCSRTGAGGTRSRGAVEWAERR